MKKSFIEIIANIGKQISEPTFIKEFEDSSILISELENIATSITDESVKDEISLDIRFIKAGDMGEKNVYYELKNSFIPMMILHNIVIQYDDYKAQLDFILITNKFICILETKKLNGNISINTDGDFVRSFTNQVGKVYKKEGMYSPISQNQRHIRILENLFTQKKVAKNIPIVSLIVIANPKSIIDFKYAKKEIREQIVKYDQLTPRLKKLLDRKDYVPLSNSIMKKVADFLTENDVELENAFIQKYSKHIHKTPVQTENSLTPNKIEPQKVDESLDVKYNNSKPILKLSEENKKLAKDALITFRLDQSRKENIKAYFIFNNNQLDKLIEKMPITFEDLIKCEGFGPAKADKYGNEILSIIKECCYGSAE